MCVVCVCVTDFMVKGVSYTKVAPARASWFRQCACSTRPHALAYRRAVEGPCMLHVVHFMYHTLSVSKKARKKVKIQRQ